jgi:hypothetical protein
MARKQRSPKKEGTPGRLAIALEAATTALSCLALLAMLVGMVIGRPALLREASRLKTTPVRLKFEWPPLAIPPGGSTHEALDGVPNTWLDIKSRIELEKIVLSHVTDDPFDAQGIRDAQQALAATGWFDAHCTVTRQPDGVIRVTGEWREPVAAVRFGNTDFLVASHGERLPPSYQPDASGLKALIGPQIAPPRLGETWIGGDVQAGLSLLQFLRAQPFYHQIAAVDVSEYNARKRLLIVTDRGSTILWGGEPGNFHAGQARDDQKRTRLLRLYRDSGRIDRGEDIVNVSLSAGF